MMSPLPRVVVLSPSGLVGSAMVVGGSRAGALGTFDFAVRFDAKVAAGAADAASKALRGREFGMRVAAGDVAGRWLDGMPPGLGVVIVTGDDTTDWETVLGVLRSSGRRGLAEVTSRESALVAVRAGFDGLVVAGHEAGGRGSEESSFIFLQAVVSRLEGDRPVWVRGGIGPRAASAAIAAGASGVVLDGALLLARESPLGPLARERVGRWDGGETIVLGRGTAAPVRVHAGPGSPVLARLREASEAGGMAWDCAVRDEVGWGRDQAWPVGQDAALAASLAARFVTVGGIVQAVESAIGEGIGAAAELRPLAEGSALAESHGTRYPIVQGPMTRVSDTVAFAEAVAEGGGLPFLALALMRGTESRALLDAARSRLVGRAWGVGILGFVPGELRREQVEEIRRVRPPFALIAGGRPDQARELDREGIATYLHVPSPSLLRQYWDDGARRFVLEGRECGGHVGPRSSFVLWEQAVGVILDALGRGGEAGEVHVLFAGGIHDARSAAAVSALAAPLAARGVRVGVLIGTAYLFTAEAVASGAIVEGFQSEALRCSRTVLLETGPGHEVRVSPTPFASLFEQERRRLLAEGRPADALRAELEGLNAGRLRVAAKGIDRVNGAGSPFVDVTADGQATRGLYMLGQAATLRDRVTTIAELHREIADGGIRRLEQVDAALSRDERASRPAPSDVAIVGMSAIVPGAGDVRTFWENTLRGHDAITEVPSDRWDWRLFYDPDPRAPDKISSKWGGFVPDVPFDPLRYGMPPASLPSIEPMHLLTLEAVRAALDDAGYRDRPFPRERTAVVLGAGGGAAQLAMGYAFRSYLPLLDTIIPDAGREALAHAGAVLPEWTEDSFPGILLNVAAGRVANRFDLGGANYTVDAACGSSLAAAALAVRELESGAADMVLLGGADTVQNPFTYLAFSKTQAFSPRGRCRPFDASADGIVISEAVAVLVLKRLADAERDGDRIYAVIKGVGASSDGRAKGLTAPRFEGQVRALRRAYDKAGVSPGTVGYVEAHGTGTAAGDLAEVQALTEVFADAGTPKNACALGSVKSLIGHTKCAAGLAGLINAALALHHRVLPPTIGVEVPNPRAGLSEGPFHISTRPRPWLHDADDRPRRAGVSAFGFGGTNFHAVLEAYEGNLAEPDAPARDWPAELFVWKAPDRARLLAEVDRLARALDDGAKPALPDLAFTLSTALDAPEGPYGLAIVATSLVDLRDKLGWTRKALAEGAEAFHDPSGVEFSSRADRAGGRVAFLFPGQGAQRPEMLRELAVAFREVRAGFEAFDGALRALGRGPIGPLVFPPPVFDDAGLARQRAALAATEAAQPALGAAGVGLLRLLDALGVVPDVVAGHSYGELVALHAAGALSVEALAGLSEARGQLLKARPDDEPGAMAALAARPDEVATLLEGLDGVVPANWNGPMQTVISGTRAAVAEALARARSRGIRAQPLPVTRAFHSPLVAEARGPLAELAARSGIEPPTRHVYSNVTAGTYPGDPAAIAAMLGDHLARPVRFAEMIEAMYADGARVFVEVGPGSTLTGLVGPILGDRPHQAVACEPPGRPGLPGLLLALARLFVAGVPVNLDRLTEGRGARRLDPTRFVPGTDADALPPSAWLVNGARARPAFGPEPPRLGPGPALPTPHRNGTHEPSSKNGHPMPAPTRSLPTFPPSPSGNLADAARVIEVFQKTMQMFLDVQRETMLGYLNGTGGEAPDLSGDLDFSRIHSPSPRNGDVEAGHAPRPEGISRNGHAGREVHADAPRPPEPTPVPAVPRRDDLAARLLMIVRDRTGYPAEMLRLDLDLEADLGIDSIKRVEILGTLREAFPGLGLESDSGLMDQLSRARTLGAIVERLSKADGSSTNLEKDRAAPMAQPPGSVGSDEPRPLRRFTLETVDAPLSDPKRGSGLATGGLVVVTDDHRGIARALAFDLRAKGHPVIRIGHGSAPGGIADPDREWVDLTSPADVSACFDRIRRRGALAGIVHALPLRDTTATGLDPAAWAARMGPEVRGLFLLARAGADDLARAAGQGGACLVAGTPMGGGFASAGRAPGEFFPGHGAIAGLVKTIAREWPRSVRVRVVDLDPGDAVEVLAANLVQEVLADDRQTEVGYLDRRRVALRTREAELTAPVGPAFELGEGEPVLVTGGARGITAAIAADLARRWRPTLLLVGTTPRPAESEDAATAGVRAPAELKAILHDRMARAGRPVGPANLERAYQDLRRSREIRDNVRALVEAGARVDYEQADVRDRAAMARVLDRWRREFGPIQGLIHGAGVIQDKLLRDKSSESFDRVLATKVEGALTLAALLDGDPLRFAAFFSSVAGRFGNAGQSDYAAANEALNKLAIWLDRRWACRVVSMIWGPWSGVGMVSDLERHLGRRGLGLIAPEQGRGRLADELIRGRKGDVEVMVAGEIGPLLDLSSSGPGGTPPVAAGLTVG